MAKKKKKEAAASTSTEGVGNKFGQIKEFFEESKVELKKVTWPSKKETITTSLAVVILTLVVATFLGLVDLALGNLIEAILQ